MQTKYACLSLAAFAFAACDNSSEKTKPAETSTTQSQVETSAVAPKAVEIPAPAPGESPADSAPANESTEPLTAEQTIAKYKSSGIPGIPEQIARNIVTNAALTESPEDQLNIINQQTTAWRRINTFRENGGPIPDHMRMTLLERLRQKHGESWINMVHELDEQIAASAKVDELRTTGLSGMTVDASHELFIQAIEKYGPDYKAILSVANQNAGK